MVYNRIPVAFGAVRRITGPTISYQYDVKQILVISGIDLPEYYVVDFCNEGDATVIPMTGTSDGVEIPDSLLQTGKPVKAYIVVSGGQGDVQTRYEVKLPVNNRPMRDDVHPTDQQQQQIDALVDALNDGVSRAETAATEAEESSGAASDDADRAEAAADRAEEAAGDVEQYAIRAETAAGHAESSAQDAAESAGIATDKADEAAGFSRSSAQSAAEASEYADAAGQSAEDASDAALRAARYADDAGASAGAAENYAGEARTSAGQAANSATSAGQSATNAAGSATTATNQAGIATTKAGEATESATAASEAQTAAETAQDKAEDAQEAAEAAQQAAEQAAQDVINKAPVIINSASGEIASFNDGADDMPIKSLVASIEPVQDLHGYDNPWPAGGGKNKLPMTLDVIKAENTNGTWSGNTFTRNGLTFTVNVDSDGNVTGIVVNGTASATTNFRLNSKSSNAFLVADTAYAMNGCPSGGGDLTFGLSTTDNTTATYKDVGSGTTFTPNSAFIGNNYVSVIYVNSGVQLSNALFKPMIRLASETDATFAPYANICPISGHTGMTVANSSLRVEVNDSTAGTYNGVVATKNSDNSVTLVGTCTGDISFDFYRSSGRFPIGLQAGGTYVVFIGNAIDTFEILSYNGQTITTLVSFSDKNYASFTIPSDATGMLVRVILKSGVTYNTTLHVFMCNPDFTTIPITWQSEAGTVYGGMFTLNSDGSGTIRVTKIYGVINNNSAFVGSENRPYQYYILVENVFGRAIASPPGATTLMIDSCNIYNPVPFTVTIANASISNYNGVMPGGASGGYVFVWHDERCATESEMRTALGNTPIQVVLNLVESDYLSYTITASQIKTLLGTNNVWTDVGEVSIDYPADTKLYIDNKIAEAIAAL